MRVLAVDDDPVALEGLRAGLGAGFDLTCLTCGAMALERLRQEPFDIVITDLRMPPPDGLAILEAMRSLGSPTPVIVLTAMDTARAAVEALRRGAADFLVKPADPQAIRDALARCTHQAGAVGRSSPATGERADIGPAAPDRHGIVGTSPAIRLAVALLPRLARCREAVLVLGETGTGKEIFARALHEESPWRTGPFVAHNMAATPAELAESIFFGHVRGSFSGASADHAGLFEQADGGTLFLDEVDSSPWTLQAKLLRVLETGSVQRVGSGAERRVDVRVVAASASDPSELVKRGTFRADLYYRLRQLEVAMPALREHLEDVPLLARHFLAELEREGGGAPELTRATLEQLMEYDWPGNVRELCNAIRSAAVMAGGRLIEPEHLPRAIHEGCRSPRPGRGHSLQAIEQRHILEVLDSVGGNQSRAARLLGIDRGTLARKLKAVRDPRKGER